MKREIADRYSKVLGRLSMIRLSSVTGVFWKELGPIENFVANKGQISKSPKIKALLLGIRNIQISGFIPNKNFSEVNLSFGVGFLEKYFKLFKIKSYSLKIFLTKKQYCPSLLHY